MAKNLNVLLKESGKLRLITACTGWKVVTITVDDGWYRDNYSSFMAPGVSVDGVPGMAAVAGGSTSSGSSSTISDGKVEGVTVAGVTATVASIAGSESKNVLGGATPEGYPLTHDSTSAKLSLTNNPDEIMHVNPRVKSFRVSMTVFLMASGLDVTVNTAAPYAAESLTVISNVAAMIPTLDIESIDDGPGT